MRVLGIDTSNYTTSCALLDTECMEILQQKQLLPVPVGQAGLRQSDAVFHHVRQLPMLMEQLFSGSDGAAADAVGVSTQPRSEEGSYMPCFLVGQGTARILSATSGAPLYETSHQMGHILAALYSADRLSWCEAGHSPFLAFHVSGGTTDCVLCTPDRERVLRITPIAQSLDLKAGQAVDRVGLMLGLEFPCGIALEALAMQSHSRKHAKITLKNGCCSLSGLQNQCETMHQKGEAAEDIARYCLNTIAAAISEMTKAAAECTGQTAVLYAGGVMSDVLIQNQLAALPYETAFAKPAFSCDNAAGVAIYAALQEKYSCRF